MEAVAERQALTETSAQHNGRPSLRLAEGKLRQARCDLARRAAFLALADVLSEDRERLARLRDEAQARVLALAAEVEDAHAAEQSQRWGP